MNKKPNDFELFNDESLWGNTDSDILDPKWNKINSIHERTNRPSWRKNVANAAKEKAKDPVWLAKILAANRERAKDPVWLAKITEINRESAKDPIRLKKLSESLKEVWQRPEMKEWADTFYNDPEYRKNLSKRNKKVAKRDHDKIVERNRKLSKDPIWLEKNAQAQAKRSVENEEWKRKNCKPVSTPYGIFENTKLAAEAYHKDYPNEVWDSVCLKLRRWYRSDKKPEWTYISWEEYDNLTK